jgi:hypothetical protein
MAAPSLFWLASIDDILLEGEGRYELATEYAAKA